MRPRPTPFATFPARAELERTFRQKHGGAKTGWAPVRRLAFGYFLPADIYECVVATLVRHDTRWLDVGGGHAIFPDNAPLAHELAARCARVVAVDPSDNVHQNTFVHERIQSVLEDYRSESPFDLATMRMVVEHVDAPELFTQALRRLIAPGGVAVVFTVNRLAPIALVSWLLPFRLHHPIKQLFWGGEDKDTFPVQYKMNTRGDLQRLFTRAGFDEVLFARLDDLSTFGHFKWLNYVELYVWRALKRLGFHYPEHCLLGVYRRRTNDA